MGNFISRAWDDLTGKTAADKISKASKGQEKSALQALEELKRQFGIQQENLQPFLDAGHAAVGNLGGEYDIGELESRLAQIMGGEYFGDLMDERTRSIEGLLGAGGLTRSGAAITEGARIPTDLAMEIENILYGRGIDDFNQRFNVASLGQNAAVQQGTGIMPTYNASMVPSQIRAQDILGGAQAQAAGMQNLMNLGGTLGAAYLMSDPDLKENIHQIGEIGPLGVYEWTWRPELSESIVADMPTKGFLSTEVKEHYPQHVYDFGGYDVIDYGALLSEMPYGHS